MKVDLTSPEILKLKLPQFRDDLEVYPGPIDPDGSPTYNVFDPIAAQYYKISWAEATILQLYRPGMTLEDLLQVVAQKTTLQVTVEQIIIFFEDAARSNLTLSYRSAEALWLQKESRRINPFKWLVYHYLYIRVPILSPDRFLARTLPHVKFLFSPMALKIYLVITFLGLFTLINRFDEYIHTFTYFFNWQGAVYYVMAILSIKIIHEFSHAYVAKNFSVRVPTMGIAFIVLWPVLYTDVTDGWKLPRRRDRLAISIAGVTSELILAGLSTLGWSVTNSGPLQSVFFIVSSTTWVTSVLINLNPAMRWDGYYLLCDLWGVDNLQPRAFAMTRWRLRKWLWGLDVPPPEDNFSTKREAGLVIYTFYTWIYRLVLYTAVALFVYTIFAKVLGIILFILEVTVFIIAPFVSEGKQLYKLRKSMKRNPRSITTLVILGLVLAWFIVPLPHSKTFPAITAPVGEQVVYVPQDGVIQKIFVKRGDKVTPGSPLVTIFSEQLENQIEQKKMEKEILEEQIRILGGINKAKERIPEKVAELESANALLNSLKDKAGLNTLKSEVTGTVYYWDDKLAPHQPVSQNKILGRIGDPKKIKVAFFVPEGDLKFIRVNSAAKFEPRTGGPSYPGTILSINPSRVSVLFYPQLASVHGGPLPVVEKGNGEQSSLQMVESYYMVDLELAASNAQLPFGMVGQVRYRGPWYSMLVELLSRLVSILWREGNF